MQKTFYVVNSFAEEPFGGNPAAVFPEGGGLDERTMQLIARQLNLVETVFVSPPAESTHDFCLRYFTPQEELPIAGHPTIAALIALMEEGKIDPQQKSCRIKTAKGIQAIALTAEASGPVVLMEQAKPVFHPILPEPARAAETFGLRAEDLLPELPVQPVDTGLGHLILPLRSLEALMRAARRIEPLRELCHGLGMREAQLFTFETYTGDMALHTRNICPREGIEDPGCGVGNAALGAYLLRHAFQDKTEIDLRAEQGTCVGMPCVIRIRARKDNEEIKVAIGGGGRVMVRGEFYLG